MNNVTGPSRGYRRNLLERLVHLQMAIGNAGFKETPAADEPTWPAQVIRAGTVLAGLGGLLLISWLRRRL